MIEDIITSIPFVYLGFYIFAYTVPLKTDEIFETQEQLQRFVERRISSSNKKHKPRITCRLEDSKECALKVGDNEYMLFACSKNIAKHELTHILGGHLRAGNLVVRHGYGEEHLRRGVDRAIGMIAYCFLYEPLALIGQMRK